ncbi:hypothetical protein BAE44_0018017, partial [Dichanthelium oligosanthes]
LPNRQRLTSVERLIHSDPRRDLPAAHHTSGSRQLLSLLI